MGLIAGLGGALAFAMSSAIVASQAQHSDTVSSSAVRIVAAGVFFAVMLFLVGGADEIAHMAAGDLLQLIGTGLLNLASGESLYLAAVGPDGADARLHHGDGGVQPLGLPPRLDRPGRDGDLGHRPGRRA